MNVKIINRFSFSKAMRAILFRTQQQLGHWVGSSVIHLGDGILIGPI